MTGTRNMLMLSLLVLVLGAAACSDADTASETETAAVATDTAAATTAAEDPVDPEPADPTADADEAVAGEGVVEFVTAEPGGEAVSYDGELADGREDAYVLDVTECCTGQQIYASVEGDVTFSVLGPDGSAFVTDQTDTAVDHDATGQWSIIVTGTGPYSIELGVSVNAS